ncbi:hypothetical protein IWX92DRAFT_355395 [Phyllosticta citricarpa]
MEEADVTVVSDTRERYRGEHAIGTRVLCCLLAGLVWFAFVCLSAGAQVRLDASQEHLFCAAVAGLAIIIFLPCHGIASSHREAIMSRCAGQVVVLRAALCARGPVDLANTGTGHLEAHCGYQRLRNKRTGERDGSDERLSDSSWSTVQCGAVQYSMAMGGLQLLGAGQTGR